MTDSPPRVENKPVKEPPSLDWLTLVPEVFDKLDKDKSRRLESSELHLDKCSEFTGKEAQAVAFLKAIQLHYRELKSSGHAQTSEEVAKSLVMTALALQQISQTERKTMKQLGTEDALKALNPIDLIDADKNSDSKLSREELKAFKAKADKAATPALAFLDKHFDRLRLMQEDPSDKDLSIAAVAKLGVLASHPTYHALERQTLSFVSRNSAVVEINRTLDNKNFVPQAVIQGFSGTCYFLAPLSASAAVAPERVAKMIKQTAPNEYTVCFPGAKDREIKVSVSEVEMRLFAATTKYGAWPTVMEKAYSQLARQDSTFRSSVFMPQYPGAEALDAGGDDEGLRVITGNKPTVIDLEEKDLTPAARESRLKETLDLLRTNEGKIVALAHSSFDQKDHEIVPGHMYAVVKLEKDKIVLRNPWGIKTPNVDKFPVHNPNEDGTFTITLEEFAKRFARISHSKF